MSSREPGAVLDGKYEIVQRLGSGGMGEVHLVRHLHLQELRVVKILRQDLAADPSAQARFLREARLATQIKHANVAILYDFARLADGSFYMVWEHIEGQDVGDRIRRHGPFPVPVAIQLGIQALRGLEAIHSAGVIHRDISPDNLMITEDRRGQFRIKIIDLGLAKALGHPEASFEITQVGMFMGKLQYCSPEQASTATGDSLDRRSDLYSLALVLYETLVGIPPFDSENQHGFIFKRLSEDPLPLVGRNPAVDIPPDLDRVVRRALERDRERRYPDAITFIQALEAVGRALNSVATQEIPIPAASLLVAGSPGAGTAAGGPGASAAAAQSAAAPPRQRSSSELSREERAELLAQIDRAAKRVREGSQVVSRVDVALSAGRLEEARMLLQQLEVANPRAPGLDQIRGRVQQAEDLAAQKRRIGETEQVLAGYLERRQLPLARLALETLLELAPTHPKREEHEAALQALAQSVELEKRADRALAAGREAIAREDLKAARRELEALARAGGPADRADDRIDDRIETLRAELAQAERGQRRTGEVEERRRRFEESLAARHLGDAEQELSALAALEVTRVMVDSYRARLEEARSVVDVEAGLAEFERRYRVMREAEDWYGAREVAQELERTLPGHPRAAALFAEVAELESEHRRREAVEQGVRQIEAFVEQGDGGKAELALKVLLQMDPQNRNRRRLEKQVRSLAKR